MPHGRDLLAPALSAAWLVPWIATWPDPRGSRLHWSLSLRQRAFWSQNLRVARFEICRSAHLLQRCVIRQRGREGYLSQGRCTAGEALGVDPMVAAVTKLTSIAQQKDDSGGMLDGGEFVGSSDASGMPTSRKNAAARFLSGFVPITDLPQHQAQHGARLHPESADAGLPISPSQCPRLVGGEIQSPELPDASDFLVGHCRAARLFTRQPRCGSQGQSLSFALPGGFSSVQVVRRLVVQVFTGRRRPGEGPLSSLIVVFLQFQLQELKHLEQSDQQGVS